MRKNGLNKKNPE